MHGSEFILLNDMKNRPKTIIKSLSNRNSKQEAIPQIPVRNMIKINYSI